MNSLSRPTTSYLDTPPCDFDPKVLSELVSKEESAKKGGSNCCYQLIDGGEEDYKKIYKLYDNSKIPGYDVKKVEVIVNPFFSEEFQIRLKLLEERAKLPVFQPNWKSGNSEENEMRLQVEEHLKERSVTPDGFSDVKVTSMFHGGNPSDFDSVFRANLANLSKRDAGFFGKGVYHTSSAEYAYKHADKSGMLLMNWISYSFAYPVIHHPEVANDIRDNKCKGWRKDVSQDLKKKHWVYLWAKPGAISCQYNVHYVLVSPEHPNDHNEENFYPPTRGQKHIYDELVSFDPSHLLPRYLIHLEPDSLHTRTLRQHTFSYVQQIDVPPDKIANIFNDIQLSTSILDWLLERRAIQQIRNRPSTLSAIPFDELFTPFDSSWSVSKAGDNPFRAVQEAMDEPKLSGAVGGRLFPLFSSDADKDLCYSYLFPFIKRKKMSRKDWESLRKYLPYLLAKTPNHVQHHRQLAILLADRYKEENCLRKALCCYVKAISIEETRRIHLLVSNIFEKIICPVIQKRVHTNNIEEGVNMVRILDRFCSNKIAFGEFLDLVQDKFSELSPQEQNEKITIQEEIFSLRGKPFRLPSHTTSQRYWEEFKSFHQFFSNEIQDFRGFQKDAVEKFIKFFKVLLDDAFLILGDPPCAYDIRAATGKIVEQLGGYAQGKFSLPKEFPPNISLGCLVLYRGQKVSYLESLQLILKTQFLLVGLKVNFQLLPADKGYQYDVLRTIGLSTNDQDLFENYKVSCFKEDFSPSVLENQEHNSKDEITLEQIQQKYRLPLMLFLSDLALSYKKDAQNIFDIIGALGNVFKINSQLSLIQCFSFLYQHFLAKDSKKTLSKENLDQLQKYYWTVLLPLCTVSDQLRSNQLKNVNLDLIAQTKGYFLKYESANFHKKLKDLLSPHQTKVKIIGSSLSGYLSSEIFPIIFDEKNNLKSKYLGKSSHNVCRLKYKDIDFHFKQQPSYPLMEYAVHSLSARITGQLTPCMELIRFEIDDEQSYPVLVSQTIEGSNWQPGQHIDLKQWTRQLLCAILIRPADGSYLNYIMNNEGKIYSVDNDLCFVEPAEIGYFEWSSKVHFFSVLFCMKPLDTPLDREVLKEFEGLDRSIILKEWIADLIQKEDECLSIFPEEERKVWFGDVKNSFTPRALLRKGTLATLDVQFFRLQRKINTSLESGINVTAGDLLKELINIRQEQVGLFVYKNYEKARQFPLEQQQKEITSSRRIGTVTNIDYLQASLGKRISFEELESGSCSLLEAQQELLASEVSYCCHVQYYNNKVTIKAKFKDFKNNQREIEIIEGLQKYPKPHTLSIKHSSMLDASLLIPFLHSDLENLDLSYCSKIGDKALSEIYNQCPNLKKLYLVNTDISHFAGNFKSPLEFSRLRYADLTKCKLKRLSVHAPLLEILKINHDLNFLKTYQNQLILMKLAEQDGNFAEYFDNDLKKDKKVMLKCILKHPDAFRHADADLRGDPKFCLKAFRKNCMVLLHLSKDQLLCLCETVSDWVHFATFLLFTSDKSKKQECLEIFEAKFSDDISQNREQLTNGLTQLTETLNKAALDSNKNPKERIEAIGVLQCLIQLHSKSMVEAQSVAEGLSKVILNSPKEPELMGAAIKAIALPIFLEFDFVKHLIHQQLNAQDEIVKAAAKKAIEEIERMIANGYYQAFLQKRKINYCTLAATLGHKEAYYELFLIYKERNEEQAYKYLKNAADNGNSEACYQLFFSYKDRFTEQEAINYCLKAADQDHAQACYEMFCFYRSKGNEQANDFCQRAARLGITEAKVFLTKPYSDRYR